MLLQKIYVLNWIDDDNKVQKYTFLKENKAEEEKKRLDEEGFDTWITLKTVPIQNKSNNNNK